MIILVSDTSVLIDLERGGLLEAVFSSGLTMVVPDILYNQELKDYNGPYLRSLGLGVVALDAEEMQIAQTIKRQKTGLSLADCFALVCAMRANHHLLSSDKLLRNEANVRIGTVHGLLWLLDRLQESGKVPLSKLYDGLSGILADPRCRQPIDETKKRLNQWIRILEDKKHGP